MIAGAVGAEASGWIITSSHQVKPGAISLGNLSVGARRALRGATGPRGAAGPAGAPGAKGDPGQAVIGDGSITTAKLADGAVDASKIAVGTVTEANMAPDSVGSLELRANAVWPGAVQNFSITPNKLSARYLVGDGGVIHGNVTAAPNGATLSVATLAGLGRITLQCSAGHSILGWVNDSSGNEQDVLGTQAHDYGSVDAPGDGRLIDYGATAGTLRLIVHDVASGVDVAGQAGVFQDGSGNCIATALVTTMNP